MNIATGETEGCGKVDDLKIACWSSARETEGISECLAAIGAVCAFYYNTNVTLCNNYISDNRIEDYFLGMRYLRTERNKPYRFYYGEPEYFRQLWERRLTYGENVEKVIGNNIRVEEPPDFSAPSLFRENSESELYILNISGKNNMATQEALEEADVVVVLFPQKKEVVEKFFKEYYSLVPKSIFLINNYQKNQKFTPGHIARHYNIERQRVNAIPHNKEYLQACEEGRAGAFIQHNLFCTATTENRNFIKKIKTAAELLIMVEKGELFATKSEST